MKPFSAGRWTAVTRSPGAAAVLVVLLALILAVPKPGWKLEFLSAPPSRLRIGFLADLLDLCASRWRRLQGTGGPPLEEPDDDGAASTVVYAIGDLHGDAECARYWVARTGLVGTNDVDGTQRWIGPPNSHLVFLGDYVDKGPTSRQTLEFVMSLTERFPTTVTAILGNHELELLMDRDAASRRRYDSWGGSGAGYFQLAYASAHPAEYLNYVGDGEDDLEDRSVVDALYNATVEVYSRGLHSRVYMTPSDDSPSSILGYVPSEVREKVRDRLAHFQARYLDAFRTGTPLGTWLENRPVLGNVSGTLFVHGGIDPDGDASALLMAAGGSVDVVNRLFASHSSESELAKFVMETREGNAIYDMLTYRGNHDAAGCSPLRRLLFEQLQGVRRLGVGHTPADSVRVSCDGAFLALDSALGRWFRNSGNDYCPGDRDRTSRNGRYQCRKIVEMDADELDHSHCRGQIVRIVNDEVEVIE